MKALVIWYSLGGNEHLSIVEVRIHQLSPKKPGGKEMGLKKKNL